MSLFPLLSHLEPLLTAIARAYALGGEIFTITALLWALNMAANLARYAYQAGQATGAFYKRHLHRYVVSGVAQYIAASLWLLESLWLGCCFIYAHRHQIQDTAAKTLHQIENLFTYQSPNVSLQPSSL